MATIYEFRVYSLHRGKLEAFKKRFGSASVPLFAKHGIKLHGFWEIGKVPEEAVPEKSAGGIFLPALGTQFGQDRIAYLVSFDSIEQRDVAWRAFVVDTEWLRLRAASEINGPLVADESTYLLSPGAFSPMNERGLS